jgi:hypothetical protein
MSVDPYSWLTCRLYGSHLLATLSVVPWSLLPSTPWGPLKGTVVVGADAVEILWCLSSVCGLGGGLLLFRASCWSALSSSVEGSVTVSTGVKRRFAGESLAWRWPSRDDVEVLLCCLLVVELLDPEPSALTSMGVFVGDVLVWKNGRSVGK